MSISLNLQTPSESQAMLDELDGLISMLDGASANARMEAGSDFFHDVETVDAVDVPTLTAVANNNANRTNSAHNPTSLLLRREAPPHDDLFSRKLSEIRSNTVKNTTTKPVDLDLNTLVDKLVDEALPEIEQRLRQRIWEQLRNG